MKKLLLSAAFIAAGFYGYSQNENFNDAFPEGYMINQDVKIGMYNNPLKGCRLDTGVVTPPIYMNTGVDGNHIATTGAGQYTSVVSTMTIRFSAFAFEPNSRDLNCDDNETTFNCATSLKAYLVPANYTSTALPTGSNILGQSDFVTISSGINQMTINVSPSLTVGTRFRVMVVGRTRDCGNVNDAQVYVIDDVTLTGEEGVLDFSDAYPAGWNFNREFKLTQYSVPGDCDNTDIGIYTTPVVANVNNSFIAAAPATSYSPTTGTINVSLDFFAFDADTRGFACRDAETTITCNLALQFFLVPASYTGTSVPTGSNIIGQSEYVNVNPTNPNVFSINIPGTLNGNMQYRVMAFARTQNCGTSNAQVYLIDNIRILEIERAVLPVTFTFFNAQRNKTNVKLTWETAMEENNRGFHVQRNIDGSWKNIGFVFTKADGGNSSTAQSYTFNDVNNSRGVSQYRLLQVDHDNKGRYSEVRSVRAENQLSKIMVYPNPSNTGNVTVMFEDASTLRDVVVTDIAGRVVKQYRNINNNTLSIENLVDGYYSIQITNQTTAATTVEKVIIKKR